VLTLILGGIRSGKSDYALQLAAATGTAVTYLATGVAADPAMERRIAAHRDRRPGAWTLIEEPVAIAAAVTTDSPTLLLESVDGWLGNLMEQAGGADAATEALRSTAVERADRDLRDLEARAGRLIAVSAEVGLAPVPLTPYGRIFVDALGDLNQRLAARADEVWLVVAGIPVPLRQQS
jgi:adenosylcobinamide kinase / adenosylcobinamide-phosphate guanylyltransferase